MFPLSPGLHYFLLSRLLNFLLFPVILDYYWRQGQFHISIALGSSTGIYKTNFPHWGTGYPLAKDQVRGYLTSLPYLTRVPSAWRMYSILDTKILVHWMFPRFNLDFILGFSPPCAQPCCTSVCDLSYGGYTCLFILWTSFFSFPFVFYISITRLDGPLVGSSP